MERKKAKNPNHPQWGGHNPKLTDHNFIDRNHKKISDQHELRATSNEPIDLSKDEPGRNRKGVREGEGKL